MLARPFRYPVRWLAFLAGGVPAVLVFPGPSLSYLAWFALVPAHGAVHPRRHHQGGRSPAAGGSAPAYLIAILQWMAPEIGPGVVLIGAVFGCMWAPFAVAVRRLLRPPASWPRALAALIVVPSCWLIPEWIRSYQGLGGPWGALRRVPVAAPGRARARRRRRSVAGQRRPRCWPTPGCCSCSALTRPGRCSRPGRPRLLAGRRGHPRRTRARHAPRRRPAAAGIALGRALGVAAFAAAAGSGPLAFALTAAVPRRPARSRSPSSSRAWCTTPRSASTPREALTAEFSANGGARGRRTPT